MGLNFLAKKLAYYFGYDIKSIDPYEVRNDLEMYYRLFSKESVESKRFYNVGAGDFRHPAWTNIDKLSKWYKESIEGTKGLVDFDLLSLKPFSIESNTAEVVYSSHTIEHITNEAALNMFKESYRVLKKGGIIRLSTPNIDLEYRAFKCNDRDYFYWIGAYSEPKNYRRIKLNKPMSNASIHQIFLQHFATSASELCADGAKERISDKELETAFAEKGYGEALDYCVSKCCLSAQERNPGFHVNWWNADKLSKMLKQAGFETVYLSGFGQSFCPVLRNTCFFDKTVPKVSLYMEAKK